MIASNSSNSDTATNEILGYACNNETEASNYSERDNDKDTEEKRENYLYWISNFGAVVTYCRWPRDGEYYLTLKYWKILKNFIIVKISLVKKPLMILAGFRNWTRGRHWDRRSRRGLK